MSMAVRAKNEIRTDGWKANCILALTGALSAALALWTNRYNVDDFLYVPDAVYRLQHPDQAIDFTSHYLYSGAAEPFHLFLYDTANAFEYSQAAFCYLFGWDFLTSYHIVMVGVLGFLFPIVLFALFRQFIANSMIAALSTLIAFAVLLLLGETHRAPGNFSITRVYQGKTVLMALGVPLLTVLFLEFVKHTGWRTWLILFAGSTAMAGLTSSSFVLIPALFSVLIIAYLVAADEPLSIKLRTSIWASSSMAYLLVCAAAFAAFAFSNLTTESPVNEGWPTTFSGHLAFLLNRDAPATIALAILVAPLAVWMSAGFERRFIFGWTLALMVFYLNPWMAQIHIRYVTSPNIFWRLFYLFPLLPSLAVVVSRVLFWLSRKAIPWRLGAAASIAVALCLPHFLHYRGSIFFEPNVAGFSMASLKLPAEWLADAKQVISRSPAGPMLAPGNLAGTIVMLDSNYPQMRVRETTLRMLMPGQENFRKAEARIRASNFLDGNFKAGDLGALKSTLAAYPELRTVVIRADVLATATAALSESKFTALQRTDRFVVATKAPL